MNEKLTLFEFVRNFLEFETKNDLFSYQIKGVKFWDYIRWSICDSIINEKKLVSPIIWPHQRTRKNIFLSAISEMLQGLRYCLCEVLSLKWLTQQKQKYDIVLFDNDTRLNIDGNFVQPVSYPLLKHLSSRFSFLVFDPSVFCDILSERYPCRVIKYRWADIISKLSAKAYRFSAKEKKTIESLNDLLKRHFSIDCDIEAKVRRIFLPQYLMSIYFKKLLKKIKPKAIVILYDGRKHHIQSAHDLGIPVVELQHGATSTVDLYYTYPNDCANSVITKPDVMFTFGDYWKNRILNYSRLVSVGLPHLEDSYTKLKGRNIVRETKIITAVSVLDYEMAKVVHESARAMPDYKFYYKLRQEEYSSWKDIYPKDMVEQANIFFIDNNNVPLFEYLSKSQYIISTCSTAIYEALYLGANVIVFKGWRYEDMTDIIDEGYVITVGNSKELIDCIKSATLSINVIDIGVLYKKNALENISEQLAKIIN